MTNRLLRTDTFLSHYTIVLDDGHRVGVSVGGRGATLVFLHGAGMHRRVYLRVLARLVARGFRVVALDAGGHGQTGVLPGAASSFDDLIELLRRSLDTLGVHDAIFLGHSMGGRMTVEFAARYPDRVIAAVLVSAAAGRPFDRIGRLALAIPLSALWGAAAVGCDGLLEHRTLRGFDHIYYAKAIAALMIRGLRKPARPVRAVRSMFASADSAVALRTMANHAIPTIVVHGQRDLVVPFDSAKDMAQLANASLHPVANGYHGWMIANPEQAADTVHDLLLVRLGDALTA
jgi:pimeloyl-ACP methyl ester carboxylesterase